MKTLWQVYLTIFVLFYRLTKVQWAGPARYAFERGIRGLSVVVILALVAMANFLQVLVGRELLEWVRLSSIVVIMLVVFFGNDHALSRKGVARRFEDRFDKLSFERCRFLMASSVVVVMGVALAFILSFYCYHQAFPGSY